jgi:hypothetical protein
VVVVSFRGIRNRRNIFYIPEESLGLSSAS